MSLDESKRHTAGGARERDPGAADETPGRNQAFDFLAAVLEHVDDGLHVVDEQRRISFINPAGAAILGYGSPSELIGLPVHETIHYKYPDGSPFPAEQCSHLSVFDKGQPVRGDDWLVRRDGSMVPVAFSSTPVMLPDGRGAVVAFRDISELRRIELEREREREFLDAVLESLDTGIVACDPNGELSLFNRASREMHGIPQQPIRSEHWASHYGLLMPDGRTPLQSEQVPLLRALRGERVRDVELVIAREGGSPITVLCNGQPIKSEDGRGLGAVVALHDVTERRRAEAQLAHDALHDSLTGLPNRALLLDRLGHALAVARRHGTAVTVLLANIDGFKLVNDSLGHRCGDELLVAVGRRLEAGLRPVQGTVARLGGDEFVVLCEGRTESEREAAIIADRVTAELAAPFRIGADEVFSSASIGVAVSGRAATPESLLRDAGSAMQRARQRGRGRYELFDETMRTRLVDRLQRENALRRAIAQDELCLHYQPIVSLSDGGLAGVEALVRWKHPVRGLLAPADFIELAEESGLIVALGSWVLRESCRQIVRWGESHGSRDAPRVSVNVSARQLADGSLLAEVEQALSAAGADPRQLALEVTETVLMEDVQAPVATLETLRRLGSPILLDDFGTGYSSLSYLDRLPLDSLKLDRSFVAALGPEGRGRAIAAAVVDLAHALGMTIVAEGVETEQQLRVLQTLGCDLAQGYLLARPMPAAEIGDLLAARAAGVRPLAAGAGRSPA